MLDEPCGNRSQVFTIDLDTSYRRVSRNGGPTSALTDLVHAAQRGSDAAFGELQALYRNRLFRQIIAIVGVREDAEDVLQDTFLRAFLALRSFEGRSQFYTWLSRIAINSALMKLRKRRLCAEVSLDWPATESDDPPPTFDVPDSALNPEEACDFGEQLERAAWAIGRLDPPLRSVVRIRALEEGSVKEIAQALNISLTAAKTRLHRARRRLRSASAFRNWKGNTGVQGRGDNAAISEKSSRTSMIDSA